MLDYPNQLHGKSLAPVDLNIPSGVKVR